MSTIDRSIFCFFNSRKNRYRHDFQLCLQLELRTFRTSTHTAGIRGFQTKLPSRTIQRIITNWGVSRNGGTPKSPPFLDGIFPYKSSISRWEFYKTIDFWGTPMTSWKPSHRCVMTMMRLDSTYDSTSIVVWLHDPVHKTPNKKDA